MGRKEARCNARSEPARRARVCLGQLGASHHWRTRSRQDHLGQFDPEDCDSQVSFGGAVRNNRTSAKRLTESTGLAAKTIHRLLEADPRRGGFKRNETDLLKCDLLVVDEASMVDVPLMASRTKALPRSEE